MKTISLLLEGTMKLNGGRERLYSLDLNHLENNENFVQDFSYSDLQPPNEIEGQITDEVVEAETYAQLAGNFLWRKP